MNLQKFTFQPCDRAAQHHDVRAGAEDPLLERRDDDRVDLGVLEAEALDGVGELDVDAEVVGVQLQLVVGREAGVLAHVHRQRGDRAVEGELPVPVVRRVGLEGDGRIGACAMAVEIERSFKLL